MARTTTSLWVAALLTIIPLAAGAADSFPLEQGNTWTFSSEDATREVTVAESYGPYHYVTGLDEDGRWLLDLSYFDSQDQEVYIWDADVQRWQPFFIEGGQWQLDLTTDYCDTFDVRALAEAGTIETPAGRFHDGIDYDVQLVPEPNVRCKAPEIGSVVLQPGVGPVTYSDARGRVYDLERAHVGARTFAARPRDVDFDGSLAVSLELDANVYTNEYNTIYCITTPCPYNDFTDTVEGELVIENRGTEPISLRFNTGQFIDAALVDEQGRTVKLWSDGRLFTQATWTLTLLPGERQTAPVQMELRDRKGMQLEGRYTVEAWVLGTKALPSVEMDVDLVPSQREPDFDNVN